MRLPRLRRRKSAEQLRRGVYIIPSLFTIANMFCGFWSLLDASHGRFGRAAVLIIVAAVADMLDGRIARLTGSTSSFGAAYDSLADVVSFGTAPAFLVYRWGLRLQPDFGLFFSFLFLVAGSIRLARFNSSGHDLGHFQGLPIPGGATAVALLVLISPAPVSHTWFIPVVMVFVLCLSLLMVSNLEYRSFKDLDLKRQWPAPTLFVLALVVALVTLRPHLLSVLLALYILSAPVAQTSRWLRRRNAPPHLESHASTRPEAPAD